MASQKPKIIHHDWHWAYPPARRTQAVRYIIVHNTGGEGTVEGIHAYHKSLGWAGVAYNFLVALDGDIHEGRGEYAVGGHCYGYNSMSIGVAFIGNYNTRKQMPDAQFKSGVAILRYLMDRYPGAALIGHKAVNSTDCPGQHFPWSDIQKALNGAIVETDLLPRNSWPKLKRMLVKFADTETGVNRDYWDGRVNVSAQTWREPARVLAWRVSGHLKDATQTARPTKKLYDALTKKVTT